MPRSNIGYHTRLNGHNSVKLVGGCFGGTLDIETANRLVASHFTVKIKPSGNPVFVDKEGREVSVYITLDPAVTKAGKAALAADYQRQAVSHAEEALKRRRIEQLLDGMSSDDALRLLNGG